MRHPSRRASSSLSLLFLTAFVAVACESGEDPVVARAGDRTLTVGELVELVAPHPQVPVTRAALLEAADLWIDYTLLAQAYAVDSTLSQVDLTPVVDDLVEKEKVAAYRRSHVRLDTALSNAQLRLQYSDDAVANSQVRARHILLLVPDEATRRQVDSVGRVAEALRRRVVDDGEDFATLAREFSADPGTRDDGGDIGYILPGEVIEPIERVAYGLQPGEVSPPFFSDLGIHILKVEGRRTPPMSEFRAWLQGRRVRQAEADFVQRRVEAADTQRTEGDVEWVRRIAAAPRRSLDSIPEDHALVAFGDGGSLTVGEVRRFFLGRPVPFQVSAAEATPEELDGLVLRTLVQGEALVAAADDAGVEVGEDRRTEIREEAREALRTIVNRIGLQPTTLSDAAIRAAVRDAMVRTLRGQQDVLPLGVYSYALWREFGGEVRLGRIGDALQEFRSVRGMTPQA